MKRFEHFSDFKMYLEGRIEPPRGPVLVHGPHVCHPYSNLLHAISLHHNNFIVVLALTFQSNARTLTSPLAYSLCSGIPRKLCVSDVGGEDALALTVRLLVIGHLRVRADARSRSPLNGSGAEVLRQSQSHRPVTRIPIVGQQNRAEPRKEAVRTVEL